MPAASGGADKLMIAMKNKKINFQDSTAKEAPKLEKDTARSKTSPLSVIIEVLLILCCLGVIGWAAFLAKDAQKAKNRDNQRLAMIKEIQNALGEYYQDYGTYPKIANTFLTALVTDSKMRLYYDPDKFRDPCFPEQKVPNLSIVECKGGTVYYSYINLNYDHNIEGYKIVVTLESGGKKEFISKPISNSTP